MALNTTISGSDSDSYVTLAEYQAYCVAMGWVSTKTDAEQEADLRRAAQYLDRNYLWHGRKTASSAARAWPRYTTVIVDGFYVSSADIPVQIGEAQIELAWIADGGVDLFATVTGGAVSAYTAKVDVISETTTYSNPREHPLFTAVSGLVAPYHRGARTGRGMASISVVR